ncbi:MAG TPA: glycosyltransferase family 9 protein, partial [Herpetosiphonaceae bacterium]|nr:glycosyltransferase family 9 protein [Herpetosiphonaceae bacterium]
YRRCALVAGVDSGPLHLAAAAGARTVTLYGPVDHRRFRSWSPEERHIVVRSGLWCSPCGAVEGCPRGTSPSECMTTIGVSQVLAAVELSRLERTTATFP